ncbi:MAG: LamG domain-containing protein [Planctomycetes bacterium]|nr:LamG domain-containing protein [Planctomycetota bacterium]
MRRRRTFVLAALASTPLSPALLAQNVVAEYAFEAGAGTTAIDASGNNNNGTLAGGAAFTEGRVCGGVKFPTGDARIEVPDSTSLRPGRGVTVEAWIRIGPFTGGYRVVVGKQVLNGDDSYVLFVAPNGLPSWSCRDATTQVFTSGTTRVDDDTWHFLTGVWDGRQLLLYVDGKLSSPQPTPFAGPIVYGSDPVSIGNDLNGASWFEGFRGSVDEVRIWDGGLDAAAVSTSHARIKDFGSKITVFGSSCPGATKTPLHSVTGDPRPNGNIEWKLTDGPNQAFAVCWLGAVKFPTGIMLWRIKQVNCNLYTDAVILFPFATDTSGAGSIKVTIPCDPTLVGNTLYSQVMTVDFATMEPVPLPLTNGIEVLIGGSKK